MPLPDFRLIRLLPLAALVLTACSVTTPKGPGKSPDSPQWRQHQQDVRNLNQYQTRGAFAYISDQQKVYARFFWQQTGQDRYRLLLTNPLGSTELELNAQPGNVQLVDNKGQRYTSADYKLDDQYRLSEITYSQNGKNWKVVYGGYDTKTQPAMPANMELTDGGQRIKLKMDNWIVK